VVSAVYRPQLSDVGLSPTHTVSAVDETGQPRDCQIAGEAPLTLFVDEREIVTLMTLGTHPEALAIGYLRNQKFIDALTEIAAVQVDWGNESVKVKTVQGIRDWDDKLGRRTVTTGCGQGTVFNGHLYTLYDIKLAPITLKQSYIYALLKVLAKHNDIYRQAGAVHGCALCQGTEVLAFVEDVGRHNAADALAGLMWLNDWTGTDKVFYTTGRLTSEIVMKAGQMGIPVLLSRSGITQMGLELARDIDMLMIARAKGQHFLVYHGAQRIEFDAIHTP